MHNLLRLIGRFRNDRRGNMVLGMAIGSLMTGVMTMIKMGKLEI